MLSLNTTVKTIPRKEEGSQEGLTYKNLATLKLKQQEKIQGALGVVTILASFYIFSVLGVQGEPNITIWYVGAAGLATLTISFLLEITALVVKQQAEDKTNDIQASSFRESEKRISLSGLECDMIITGLV